MPVPPPLTPRLLADTLGSAFLACRVAGSGELRRDHPPRRVPYPDITPAGAAAVVGSAA
jgi:hypothetical protein